MTGELLVWWLMAGACVLVFGYALVRTMSFAYFKTKLEYLRSVIRETKKDDSNNA